MMFVWNKGEHRPLSQFFNSREMECKCSRPECVEQRIDVELIDRLDKLRQAAQSPVYVHSAYRCEAHNVAIGGAPKSQHVLGRAVDISTSRQTPIELREKIAKHLFKAIGTAKNFLHLDLREDKERRWTY